MLLSSIGAFLPLATDGFLPAMRPMMAEFGASVASGQLTISVTLAGFAVAQLLVGVVADRFGRRPVLILATGLFALASVGVAVAPSLKTLLLCRFLQGLSAAAGPVIMRAVVRDLCSRIEGARVLSYLGMGMGAVPLAIPAINAQVAVAFGWRATLGVCVLYLGAVLWMTLAWFRETLENPDPRALSPGELGRVLRGVLGHPQALGYMLCCMFGYAGLAVWISCAPHLLQEYFHQPAGSFGLLVGNSGPHLRARRVPECAQPAPPLERHDAESGRRGTARERRRALAAPCRAVAAGRRVRRRRRSLQCRLGDRAARTRQAGALSYFPHLAGRVALSSKWRQRGRGGGGVAGGGGGLAGGVAPAPGPAHRRHRRQRLHLTSTYGRA